MVGLWSWGLTFTDVLRIGGLTFIGANYWEVAWIDFPRKFEIGFYVDASTRRRVDASKQIFAG